jgi:hypothetical protein
MKRPKRQLTVRRALTDKTLLGSVLGGESWATWRTLLIAAMGEALDDKERETFKRLTGGRECEPLERVEELVAVVGRRGGKSRAIAALACFLAGLRDHHNVLAPGERALVLCIAPDTRQAHVVLDYCEAIFQSSPILRQLIRNRTSDTLELTNGVDIEVRAASFRRLRGHTFIAAIADEAAFYFADESSANPDSEILAAVRPGLATTGGLLAMISSPYAKRGELFEAYRRHYGPAGDPRILVAQGTSRDFNPSLPQAVIDRALERDHAAASTEYLAQFRSDIETFIAREQVDACVEHGVYERAPIKGVRYFSFTDPSGGSSDSMVCAVGHMDDDMLVIDAIREIRSPFDPESAVEEIAQLLALYKVDATTGDRYSGQWCAQSFEKRSINYEHSEQNKSQLYIEMLPRLNAKTIRLLDHPRMINQICLLERRTVRGGRDSIDHPPNTHDDIANAIAGLCGIAASKHSFDSSLSWVGGPGIDDDRSDWVQAPPNVQYATRRRRWVPGVGWQGAEAPEARPPQPSRPANGNGDAAPNWARAQAFARYFNGGAPFICGSRHR